MLTLKVKRIHPQARLPFKSTDHSAAFDLFALQMNCLLGGEFRFVRTGIAVEIPEGYLGYVRPRSGKATKEGLVLRSSNIIDSDYRGELMICCYALGVERLNIEEGEKIAQMLILPVPSCTVEEVSELSVTQRGEGGFGSTGKR